MMLNVRRLRSILFFILIVSLTACLKDGEETIVLETGNGLGIPSDSEADPNPSVGNSTVYVPNFQYSIENEGGFTVVRIDMTGIQNPETLEWLRLLGTSNKGQNIWISVDGKPKGFLVYNNSDEMDNTKIMTDVIFLVDNSGSMSEEADAIARDIVSWASKLSNSNLDVQFGCVGYNGSINGGLNITTANYLSEYLNRTLGTSRTVGFDGNDASALSNSARHYEVRGECGVLALRFADENFSFRAGANRIYVNFTDEPNQPGGLENYSVEYVSNQVTWATSKGAIHTVFSDDTTFSESRYTREKPWRMSRYTGGTELYASSNFYGVSLDGLPVTGAMQNSYVIRFTNVDDLMDGKAHSLKITVLSDDKNVRGERTFSVIFGEKK